MTVNLSYNPDLSRVRISMTDLGDANTALVERSVNGVRWETVRGGDAVPVSAGAAQLDDYEFIPGVSNTYRVTPFVMDDFESVTPLAITGTWLRSQMSAHEGSWAYKSADISDGETSDAVVTIPVNATQVDFWFRISSEYGSDYFRFFVDGVQVGFNSGDVQWSYVPAGTYDISAATTLTFRYEKDVSGSDGLDAVFVDNLRFTLVPESASITPELDTIWLKSLARPFLNRRIKLVDFSAIERSSRNGVFQIVGRSAPVAVTDLRGSRTITLTVMVPDVDDANDLDLVLASGDPVLVQVPPGCPIPSMYAVIGDVTQNRRSMRGVRRFFNLPLTEVAAPGPDVIGATITYQGILSTFATYADLLSTEATYEDVAERIGNPEDVIVS